MVNELLILTTTVLRGGFDDFVSYKQRKGFNVNVRVVETLNGWADAKFNEDKIKIIESLVMASVPENSYVMIGGIYDDIPSQVVEKETNKINFSMREFASDTPYALASGDKMKFSIARLPFSNVQEVKRICSIYINYTFRLLTSPLLVADTASEKALDHCKDIQKILSKSITNSPIIENWKINDVTRLIEEINQKDLIIYRGHGHTIYWNYWSGDRMENFTCQKIPQLAVSPHIACFACRTAGCSAKYIDMKTGQIINSISLGWLQKGALSYFGSTRTTQSIKNQKMAKKMCELLASHQVHTVGELYMRIINETVFKKGGIEQKKGYTLLGDPTIEISLM